MAGETIYRQRVTFCGKPGCRPCEEGRGHGPYWYAYQTVNGRTKQTYVGKVLPPNIEAEASTPAALIRLHVLGQVYLERRAKGSEEGWYPVRDTTWNAPIRPLLAALASSNERRLSLSQVRELLGSKASTADVQRAIERLRYVLEPPRRVNQQHVLATRLVEATSDSLVLADQARLWIDADAFESLISQARATDKTDEREHLLEEALLLYNGDYWPTTSEREARWTLARRQGLRRQWLELLLDLADLHRARSDGEGAMALLDRLLAIDPTNEAAVQRIMFLLARVGRRGEALRLYQRFLDALTRQDESMRAAPETQHLYEAVRSGEMPEHLTLSTDLPKQRPPETRAFTQVGRSNQSRLVGRSQELAALLALLLDAEQQRQQRRSVVLTGEAGMGKTRLVEEMARDAAQRGWVIAWGRAYAQETAIPYRLWTETLRKAMRQGPGLRQELARRPHLYQPLLTLLPDLEGMLPPDQAALAPEQDQVRLWEAIRALLRAISETTPLLIVLDDVQWADNSSCDLLAYLVRQLHDAPVLIACTCRGSELPPAHPLRAILRDLQHEQALELMAVPPLTDEQIRVLVSALPEPLVRDIQIRAAGNPFFAEELARSAESVLPDRLTTLPDSVAAVLDLRLERVSEACQRMLTRAAVLGGSFDFGTLRALENGSGALDEDQLLDLVEEALRAGVLMEEENGSHTTYSFWHPVAVSHLYGRLSAVRRISLHRRVADALRIRYADQEQQGAAGIVYHLARGGGEPARITHFAELAGDQSYLLFAYPEATLYYRLAVEHLNPSPITAPSSLTEQLHLSNLLERLGECERVQGHDTEACLAYEHALSLRPTPPRDEEDAQITALLWVEIGKTWYDRREHDQAQQCYRRAEETLYSAGIGTGPAWASLSLQKSYAFWQVGDVERARQAASRALQLFESIQPAPLDHMQGDDWPRTAIQRTLTGDPVDPGRAHLLLGTLAAVTGEQEALHHLQEALTIFERYDRPREIAMICCNLGDYYMRQAELTPAQAALRRSLNTAERIGDVPIMSVSAGNLGLIAARVGDLSEAERLATRAVLLAEQMHDPFYLSLWHSYLASALVQQGKIEQAKTSLSQALKAGRGIQSASCVAVALVVVSQLRLALALQHQGDVAVLLHKAMCALRRALAMEGLEAETRLEGLLAKARIASWRGDLEAARQDIDQVIEEARREALPGMLAAAQRLLGMLLAGVRRGTAARQNQPTTLASWKLAEAAFQDALAICGRLGMRLEYGRTLRDYGAALLQLQQAERDDQQGLSLLREASHIFETCHATLDLVLAEQILSAFPGAGATQG